MWPRLLICVIMYEKKLTSGTLNEYYDKNYQAVSYLPASCT